MRQSGQHVARKAGVDRLDDLIVVVAHAGNLGDILVQPDEVALFRGVGPDHAERLVEDSPDDEAAAVVLHPPFTGIRSKRICCSSVRRKEYLRLLLSDARFFLIVLSF